MAKRTVATAAATGAAAVVAVRLRRARAMDVAGKVVLVTGGSRGLGLTIAREFAARGARIALCARNGEQVDQAVAELRHAGRTAWGAACDVRDPGQTRAFVDEVIETYGRLDVVVANAGIIAVGPWDSMTDADMADAVDTMFWGVHHTVRAALEHLDEGARIAVVTSIGGKIAVPHLVPYSVAKFAAVGLAEGLRSELADRGIAVTTVVPGLMRTGSHVNALMKGDSSAEYTWFSAGAVLPGLATTAEHAARRILRGVRRGDAEVLIGWQTHLAVRAHGLAPATTTRLLAVVARLLPDAPPGPRARDAELGADTGGGIDAVTALGQPAVRRHREDRR